MIISVLVYMSVNVYIPCRMGVYTELKIWSQFDSDADWADNIVMLVFLWTWRIVHNNSHLTPNWIIIILWVIVDGSQTSLKFRHIHWDKSTIVVPHWSSAKLWKKTALFFCVISHLLSKTQAITSDSHQGVRGWIQLNLKYYLPRITYLHHLICLNYRLLWLLFM